MSPGQRFSVFFVHIVALASTVILLRMLLKFFSSTLYASMAQCVTMGLLDHLDSDGRPGAAVLLQRAVTSKPG